MFISLLKKGKESMNKNMRKMYTEEEIINLIKKANSNGDVNFGKKLYIHNIQFSVKSGQTVAEGCESSLYLKVVATAPSIKINQYMLMRNDILNNGLSMVVNADFLIKLYLIGGNMYFVGQPAQNATEETLKLDIVSKYTITDNVEAF